MLSIHRQLAGPFFSERSRQQYLPLVGLGLLSLFVAVASADEKPTVLIGYTEGRNDLEGGQFVNWVTNRACVVGADGKGRKILAQELTKKEHSWTQFAGWSPDGKTAIIGSHWESAENAAWEREYKTFRMTEGWLSDTCLLNLASGKITNVTAVDRISDYNTGLFYLPDGKGFGFTPLIKGVSKPYVMDPDGKNKRDVSGQGGGFAYGYSASPDGKRISYHENYQVYIANANGGDKRKVETKNPFNFAPRWSPDGEWLLFVSGEHYNCHPHIVKKDSTGLKKLAERGGYRGVVEVLKHPDFHSESSDTPVWSADGRHVFYTAKVGDSIELMRVDLDGNVTQLTKSKPGTRHYHPAVSPDGKWVLFGSDRSGTMQLYVATTDGKDSWPITNVPAGSCAMYGHWRPVVTKPGGLERAIPKEKPSGITPRVVEHNGVLGVEYRSGDLLVGRSTESAPAGVHLRLPGKDLAPVEFRSQRTDGDNGAMAQRVGREETRSRQPFRKVHVGRSDRLCGARVQPLDRVIPPYWFDFLTRLLSQEACRTSVRAGGWHGRGHNSPERHPRPCADDLGRSSPLEEMLPGGREHFGERMRLPTHGVAAWPGRFCPQRRIMVLRAVWVA